MEVKNDRFEGLVPHGFWACIESMANGVASSWTTVLASCRVALDEASERTRDGVVPRTDPGER